VLYKLQLSGCGDLFILNSVLEFLEMNHWSFLNMCIAVGCDYLPNVKGVGINTAKKLVKEKQSFLDDLTKLSNAPQDYGDQFLSARAIFMHQTILDPDKLTTTPLTQWSECNSGLNAKLQEYCGMYPFIHFFCLSSFYANIVYCIFICKVVINTLEKYA
jgi:hypothetical protein